MDFLEPSNKLVFRTCPELERSKLVFQLGTANPELAVQAAKVVAKDVDAIDVNSGCPKHFSIHSGMGAALLQTPDILESILKSLVSEVGKPYNINISVKIRLLDDLGEESEKTFELVRRLVKTGISCLTLHCRTTPMRPRESAIRGSLYKVADICREANVACLVNGDVDGRWQLQELIDQYKVDGAMIARGAETNVSCFGNSLQSWQTVSKEFVKLCHQYDNSYMNTKFCLARMIPGKHSAFQKTASSKTMEAIKDVILNEPEPEQQAKGEAKANANVEEKFTVPLKRSVEEDLLERVYRKQQVQAVV